MGPGPDLTGTAHLARGFATGSPTVTTEIGQLQDNPGPLEGA